MMPAPMSTTSGFDDDAVAVFVDRAVTEFPLLSLIAISPTAGMLCSQSSFF
jgi:hypothetical protein